MSQNAYTAFQRHLIFFSTQTNPPRLTFLSGLRASIALGLNFPVSVLLSLSVRLLYARFPYITSPSIKEIPQSQHRSQLSSAKIPDSKSEYTCSELLSLLQADHGLHAEQRKGFLERRINEIHITSLWAIAANTRTHTVSREDVERFQQGEWEEAVAKRRREREDVLPFWRGGPILVGPHSWAVRKLLGVRVYEVKQQ